MPATRAATLTFSPLRACCRHERFKPQLACVILLRKNLNQLKRVGFVVKRKVQHRAVARHAIALVGRRTLHVIHKLLDGRAMAYREHARMVRTLHKLDQRRHHALAHLHLALAAKLAIEVAPRALGHKHHALGLKVAKEPLSQTVQALVRQARPQVGDSLLGAMKRGGVGMIGLNATRT